MRMDFKEQESVINNQVINNLSKKTIYLDTIASDFNLLKIDLQTEPLQAYYNNKNAPAYSRWLKVGIKTYLTHLRINN